MTMMTLSYEYCMISNHKNQWLIEGVPMLNRLKINQKAKKPQPMNKKYHLFARNILFKSDTETQCEMFMKLVKYCDIEQLIGNTDFQKLTEIAIKNLPAETVFTNLAIELVQRNKVAAIKFLISDCKFKLTHLSDENKITLLHEACLHNSEDVADYLISQKADPYAEDSDGGMPLHRVAQQQSGVSLIDIFKKYRVDLNRKNSQGMTVLHLAALLQNFTLVAKLIKTKADTKIKFQNMSYLELSKAVKNGTTKVSQPPIPEIVTHDDEKNEAHLLLQKISEKLNIQLLNEIKNFFLNKSSPLNDIEARLLLDAYLLAMPFNLQNFKKFFKSIIAKKIITVSDEIRLPIVIIEFLRDDSNFVLTESVCEIMEEALRKLAIPKDEWVEIMNYLLVVFNSFGAFAKAEKIISAVSGDLSAINSHKHSELLWNMGITYQNQNRIETAAPYYKKAFELVKDDIDIFRSYFLYLVNKQDYEQAAQICKLSSCGEFTSVAKKLVKCLSGKISWQELLDALKDNYSNYDTQIFALDLKCRCLLMVNNLEKATETAEFIFNLQLKEIHNPISNFAHTILKRALVYIDCKDFKGALRFYEAYQQKYPQLYEAYPPLKQFSAVIYLANGNIEKTESIIENIGSSAEVTFQMSQLYLGLALECINLSNKSEKLEKGQRYFALATKFAPTNIIIPFLYKLFLQINEAIGLWPAQSDLEHDLEMEDFLPPDLFKEKFNEAGEENYDSTDESYDPKKIHQFFQQQKKQAIAMLSVSFTKTFIQKASWVVDGCHLQESEEEVVSINSQFYPNHFAMITPDLQLDSAIAEQFNQALQKGLAKKSNAQNGIKFLRGIIELKINHDLRLYTNKIYKNADGQCLIIFDTLGNHQDIKKQIKDGKPLQVISVERAKQARNLENSTKTSSSLGNYSNSNANLFFPAGNAEDVETALSNREALKAGFCEK